MSAVPLRHRLLELERFDAPAGLLPLVLADDAPDADLDRLRRQGWQVSRLTDFVGDCA